MTRVEAFREVALQVLHERSPMHFQKIADRAMNLRLISLDETTIQSYMNATLASSIAEHGSDSAFISESPGRYGLNSRHGCPKRLSTAKTPPISRLFRRAAFKVLEEQRAMLRYKDIAEIAVSRGMIELTGTTIHRCMGAILHDDIAQCGTRSAFVAPKPGWYGLNPKRTLDASSPTGSSKHAARPAPKRSPNETLSVPVDCLGKGGEYLVASKLSFLGYVVHEPGTDRGIDLVATKDAKTYYNFQVKTSATSCCTRKFTITKSTFEKTSHCNLFFVLVIRHPHEDKPYEDFFVIPHGVIQKHISGNSLRAIGNRYTIKVAQEGDGFSLVPNVDITRYRDNWDVIK